MNDQKIQIKLTFISGLKEIVLGELSTHSHLQIIEEDQESVHIDFIQDFAQITSLRSVLRAFIVAQDSRYTPRYISNHKSILGDVIARVFEGKKELFKTFKISCAGSDSPEVRSIADYIYNTYGLTEAEEADMKIHIINTGKTWEFGVEMTPRPLSSREYRTLNLSGAMNSTIAYAVNSLSNLENAKTYLNVFSGSATLLIEAAACYPNLKQLIGFDNDKESITLAIQNIRKAGLMKRIQLKGKDIFDKPDLGRFDAITSDLPFGMLVSKNENLEKLYECFVSYCEGALNQGGRLVAYTNEHQLLKKILSDSNFNINKAFDLKLMTSANLYIHPRIFVCELKRF